MGRAYSMHEKKRNAFRVMMEKSERKRPVGRPKDRWEDNIKMDLREIGWGGKGCIEVA
jgi:hypothetical protein